MNYKDHKANPCNLVIIGASGDLARKKILPALFSLYCNNMLPENFTVMGFARSHMSDDEFREKAMANLTCRYVPGENCGEIMDRFLSRCFYQSGQYAEADSYRAMDERIQEVGVSNSNYLFYMAIPPSVFLDTATALKGAGLFDENGSGNWRRAVLEKPFGHDTESCCELLAAMKNLLPEEQTYRIDHYLGKEVIQNLLILRFSNLFFEPIWNHRYIDSVDIWWSEKIGVPGRAGYFDNYGIVRDVIQNHLMQVLSLVAMEPPAKGDPKHICDEKVKLLECCEPIALEDIIVGQYEGNDTTQGYLKEDGVPEGSLTPTYARATMRINNSRWHGVPFTLTAGKAMKETLSEIRIRFKPVPYSIFSEAEGMKPNELVVRIQPNESIKLNIVNKYPGLGLQLQPSDLNLHYESTFNKKVHDAYERLLLDVLRGEKTLFPRSDELKAAWELVTPVLDALQDEGVKPQPYEFGSCGPRILSWGNSEPKKC